MKTTTIRAVLTVSLLLAGCGKHSTPSGSTPSGSIPTNSTPSVATPVAHPAIAAWEQGDKSTAMSAFVDADWSKRPLFGSTSALILTDAQLTALTDAERQAKSAELKSQLDSFKQLTAAVAQAGRDAASKGDAAQARKYFTSLKQCGTALDNPESMSLVQFVGRALKKTADTELEKPGK